MNFFKWPPLGQFWTTFCTFISAIFKYTGCSYKILILFIQQFGMYVPVTIFFQSFKLKTIPLMKLKFNRSKQYVKITQLCWIYAEFKNCLQFLSSLASVSYQNHIYTFPACIIKLQFFNLYMSRFLCLTYFFFFFKFKKS